MVTDTKRAFPWVALSSDLGRNLASFILWLLMLKQKFWRWILGYHRGITIWRTKRKIILNRRHQTWSADSTVVISSFNRARICPYGFSIFADFEATLIQRMDSRPSSNRPLPNAHTWSPFSECTFQSFSQSCPYLWLGRKGRKEYNTFSYFAHISNKDIFTRLYSHCTVTQSPIVIAPFKPSLHLWMKTADWIC